MKGLKRQAPGALLLGTAEFRWHCTDRGIGWVYDAYGLVRADLLRAGSSAGEVRPGSGARGILDRVRAESALPGTVKVTGGLVEMPVTCVIVGTLFVHVAINPRAWAGWSRTGCTPRLTNRGTLLWFAPIRGRDALFGVVASMRLGTIAAVAT